MGYNSDVPQILFHLRIFNGIPQKAISRIAKSPELRNFLSTAIKNDCHIMNQVLHRAIRECSTRMMIEDKNSRKQKEQEAAEQRKEEKEQSRKRMGENPMNVSTIKRFKFFHDGNAREHEAHTMESNTGQDRSSGNYEASALFRQKEKEYRIEVGITRGESKFTKPLKDYCRTLPLYKISKEPELRAIFRACASLSFRQAKYLLLQHLRDRIDAPCVKIQMPEMWRMRKPDQICIALDTIKASTLDMHIHRAYGEMCLVVSVDAAAKSMPVQLRASKTCQDAHILVLEDCAMNNGGGVAPREWKEISDRYKADYYAGQKWHEISEMFGGCGIVLIFLCANISGGWVRKNWKRFQRQCLRHIALHLFSIRELVEVMGDDVLDRFCRHGYLDEETVATFEEVEGCLDLKLDDDGTENIESDPRESDDEAEHNVEEIESDGDEAEDDEEEAEDGNEDDAQDDGDHDDGHDEEQQE